MPTINYINEMEHINANLYRFEHRYYRLFAYGVTPNGCWLINPHFRELKDISISTGEDIFGDRRVDFFGYSGGIGAVPQGYKFIKYY